MNINNIYEIYLNSLVLCITMYQIIHTFVPVINHQHQNNPIGFDVMKAFLVEIQNFINATWYNPDAALERGSFV